MKALLLFLFTLNAYAATIPNSWRSDSIDDFNPHDKHHDQFSRELDTLIDDLHDIAVFEGEDKLNQKRKMELTRVSTMIGVAASGSIGVLGINGAALAQIHWSPKENQQVIKRKKIQVHFDEGTSLETFDQKLMDLADRLEDSGKVKKGTGLRKNLKDAAYRFRNLVKNVRPLHRKWVIDAIMANISFNASGSVNLINFGASVEIALVWTFKEQEEKSLTKPLNSLEKVVWSISDELDHAFDESKVLTPVEWEIGLGIGVDATVGIASAGVGIASTVVFVPNENYSSDKENLHAFEAKEIPLIIPSDLKSEERVLKIAKRKFRKGIKKALRIGDHLAKKAMKKKRKWKFSGMITDFELGLSGGIGVVTLSGGAAVRIVWENPNF